MTAPNTTTPASPALTPSLEGLEAVRALYRQACRRDAGTAYQWAARDALDWLAKTQGRPLMDILCDAGCALGAYSRACPLTRPEG